MNRAPTFGIEEEYFITDLQSREMLAQPSAQVLQACRQAIGKGFSFEMFQGQIEVASPVFNVRSEARAYLGAVRTNLGKSLAELGLGVVCSGSHPLARWHDQRAASQAHFQQFFQEFQRVAQRSVLCGLHVHVEVPATVDRIAVMNEVSPWLPLLLLLSCSSPFWEGEASGFMSYRQAACDEWPRMGVPEYFANWNAYHRYLNLLRRVGALDTDGNGWWGIRPAVRYPTLELRMTDACPRLADVLTLATLFRVMVAHASNLPQPGVNFTMEDRWLLKENRWRAKRYGVYGTFAIGPEGLLVSALQWLEYASQVFGTTCDAMGESGVFEQARAIVQSGNSADRQLRCHEAAHASGADDQSCLQRVVDQLLVETHNP